MRFRAIGLAAAALGVAGPSVALADEVPLQFRGEWAPSGNCQALARLRVEKEKLALINGADVVQFGDVAIPTTFFGPDYTGIAVVALPEVTKGYPFTLIFNPDEKRGLARVEIYHEMPGPQNPAVQALQAAAKALAQRFPLDHLPLRKCTASQKAVPK